jgi:hypothetical protein
MNKTKKMLFFAFIVMVLIIGCSFMDADSIRDADIKNAKGHLITPTDDGKNQVTHPDMVYFSEGFSGYKYWMASTPYPYSDQKYENPYILVSNDGINFIKPEEEGEFLIPPPKDWAKGGHYSDTDMYFYKDRLVLHFVHNIRGIAGPSKFYRMESVDGINWSKPKVIYTCNETTEGYSPAYIWEGAETLKMWYVGGEGNFSFVQSDDNEKTWHEVRTCIIDMPEGWKTWHVDVVKSDKGYEGLMCARNINLNTRALFFIESIDGIKWNCSKEPIVYPFKGAWDSKEIYRATMIKSRNTYRVWYSASGTGGKWNIGYTVINRNDINIDRKYKVFHQKKQSIRYIPKKSKYKLTRVLYACLQ